LSHSTMFAVRALPSISRSLLRPFSSGAAVKPLVVVETLPDGSLGGGTAMTVSAATQLGGEVTAVVSGSKAADAAKAVADISGVSKVLVVEDAALDRGLAESHGPLYAELQKEHNFSHVLFGATTFGKAVMPTTAALLDVSPLSEITAVKSATTFERLIYAGNAVATFESSDAVKVGSVRPTNFDAAPSGGSAAIETSSAKAGDNSKTSWVSEEVTKSDRPDLASAKIVVAGGRAVKSEENMTKYIDELGDKMGAALGASRAAVDQGFCPNERQVGQTGKIVAPELYVAVGISGAIQHVAGMKDSKVIVAINKDADAPIFQIADYGLVGDLFDVVPEMMQKL